MLHLINELLSTAAIESGYYVLNQSSENLSSLIEASMNACIISASKKKIKIELSGMKDVQIQCDGLKIQEVFENLISNAVKYSLPETKVEIAIENHQQSSRKGFLIRVKDQGLGMTEEDLTKIFGRFQRLSARPTGGEASTGLGLSIVKKIIELHGGTVSAFSEGKGLGTEFRIFLPSNAKAL
jgi:signal transduction histidine kinase